jgi:hypothetical protein
MTDTLEEIDTISQRAGLSRRDGHRLLGILVNERRVLRDGKGVKGDPYRFRLNSIHAGVLSYKHESNCTKPDSIHATPPSPCTNSNGPNDLGEVVDVD